MTAEIDRWFEGKVAIVTGASLGIGRGIAEALVEAGVSVAIVGRSAERMGAAAERLRANGGDVLPIGANVVDPSDARRLVDETVQRFGRLDFLVNSAGTRSFSLVHETSLTAWDEVVEVQLTGTFLVCQAAVDPLMASGGRIVNLSSMFGYLGRANGASYAAAKAGVSAFTRVLASELAPAVTVNAIAPGRIETERFGVGLSEEERISQRAIYAAEIPMARVGRPEDVAWVTMYLLGPGAGWMTGQVIHLNGGVMMP